jgi:hypothetical protein
MNVPLRLLTLTLAAALAHADEPAPPPLSGRWTLDVEKSEDGRKKLREAGPMRGPRGGGGPTGGGPRSGAPGGGTRGRGGSGGPGGGGLPDAMRSVVEAPPALTITVTPTEITILEEEGRFRALHPDRKEYKGTGGEKIETRWEGARLVVETKGERGGKLVETFTLEGEELVSELRLAAGRGEPLTVRRVYRRAAQETPPAASARGPAPAAAP